MALNSTHPQYALTVQDILLMRHIYSGERTVKELGDMYLPPTPGMRLDGMIVGQEGYESYDAYKKRAVLPDYVSDAVEALLGLMHQRPAKFDVPKAMEGILTNATADGETLQNLLRRINEQQIVVGRLGALLDLEQNPNPANPLPFISLYNAETIRNWDDGADNVDRNKLAFVVLDETGPKRNANFEWTQEQRYRVLMLGELNAAAEGKKAYSYGVFSGANADFNQEAMLVPTLRGVSLDTVPFVFINSKDTLPRPDNPPLLGLARKVLTIYRGEADYRQALFMQGQDTLVVIGGLDAADEESRVGAGAKLSVEMGGDAKYIGVSSNGLPEMRMALENDKKEAIAKTGQLIDAMGSKQESGEALGIRLAAQTATLNQIALTGAAALEHLLRVAAQWLGLNPDDVKVTPNLEFADLNMSGKDVVDLMTAKNMGAPLSKETIHNLIAVRGLTDKTFEEEMDLIEDEDPLMGTTAGALGLQGLEAKNGPVDEQAPQEVPPKKAPK